MNNKNPAVWESAEIVKYFVKFWKLTVFIFFIFNYFSFLYVSFTSFKTRLHQKEEKVEFIDSNQFRLKAPT